LEKEMSIVDSKWFCGRTNVGIVMVDDPFDGVRYYISAFSPTSEDKDSDFIASYGSSFPRDVGDVLFRGDKIRSGEEVVIPVSIEHAQAMARVALMYLAEHVKKENND